MLTLTADWQCWQLSEMLTSGWDVDSNVDSAPGGQERLCVRAPRPVQAEEEAEARPENQWASLLPQEVLHKVRPVSGF